MIKLALNHFLDAFFCLLFWWSIWFIFFLLINYLTILQFWDGLWRLTNFRLLFYVEDRRERNYFTVSFRFTVFKNIALLWSFWFGIVLLKIFKVKVTRWTNFNFDIHEFLFLGEKVISIWKAINLWGKIYFGVLMML